MMRLVILFWAIAVEILTHVNEGWDGVSAAWLIWWVLGWYVRIGVAMKVTFNQKLRKVNYFKYLQINAYSLILFFAPIKLTIS